jgi:hypothetical protein
MALQLRKFNMNMIQDNKNIVITGDQNTGKSFLTKDLLFHHQDIPVGVVISPNENSHSFYKDFVPPVFIHNEYNSKITKQFITRQKELRSKKSNQKVDFDTRAFLIMDNCLCDKNWKKDPSILEIFMNGCFLNVMFILQENVSIPPNLRASTDWIFIFPTTLRKEKKRLYEGYAGMFPTFDMFSKTMDDYNEDNKCLVINNCSPSPHLEDQVFWYKAEEHESFKSCSPEVWQFNQDYSIQKEKETDV